MREIIPQAILTLPLLFILLAISLIAVDKNRLILLKGYSYVCFFSIPSINIFLSNSIVTLVSNYPLALPEEEIV